MTPVAHPPAPQLRLRISGLSFAVGLLFAAGLVLSGMTQPKKVIAFLDLFHGWDPSLALVMGGAVAVYGLAHRLILKRPAPVLEPKFYLPSRRDIDSRLVLGAALFGAGWGLAGVCPGPAIVAAASGALPPMVFVAAMMAGMELNRIATALSQEE